MLPLFTFFLLVQNNAHLIKIYNMATLKIEKPEEICFYNLNNDTNNNIIGFKDRVKFPEYLR